MSVCVFLCVYFMVHEAPLAAFCLHVVGFYFFCCCFVLSLMCVIHISVNEHKQTMCSLLNSLLVHRMVRNRKKTCTRLHQVNCFVAARFILSSSLINDCSSSHIGLSCKAVDDAQSVTPKAIIVISALMNRSLLN